MSNYLSYTQTTKYPNRRLKFNDMFSPA